MKKLLATVFLLFLVGSFASFPFHRHRRQYDIPKIIHYCWFGDAELPDYAEQVLNSWKETNPAFRIKRWDEHNFDVRRTPFLQQAYESKNYAYVADVCRLEALKKYGGLYLDTDHMLKKDVRPYLTGNLVLTFEAKNRLSGSFIAATKNHPFIGILLAYYNNKKEFNATPITQIMSYYFKKMYSQPPAGNHFQKIKDVVLWPTNVLMINFGGKENAATHLYANTGNHQRITLFGHYYHVFQKKFLNEQALRVHHPDKQTTTDFLIEIPPDNKAYFYSDKQHVTILYRGTSVMVLFNRRHGLMIRLKQGDEWIMPSLWLKQF